MARSRSCPHCGKVFLVESERDWKTLPFCSERCQLSDLYSWFEGDYKISRRIEEADLSEIEGNLEGEGDDVQWKKKPSDDEDSGEG